MASIPHMAEEDSAIKFLDLCMIFQKISETKKRLEIQDHLTRFYQKVIEEDPESLVPVLYLCTGTLAPECHNRELGIGESMILKVISEASSKSIKAIKDEYKTTGDLGAIASKYRSNHLNVFKKKNLTAIQVYHGMIQISREEGTKSQNAKLRRMLYLMTNTQGIETKYLIRILEGKLKIGLALKTVLISLAFATSVDGFDFSENLKAAYSCQPIFETIAPLLLKHGSKEIHNHVGVQPGIPLKPMLAQPIKDITSAFKRFEGDFFTCEYKYDGERAQIHKYGDELKVYSRNTEDLTGKYPDLRLMLEGIPKSGFDFVLDCEIVAFDKKNNKLLPFQTLSTRKRKNVEIEHLEVGVCVFVFDILYFGNASTISKKLCERRRILLDNFGEGERFKFVTFSDCASVDEIDTLFNNSIKDNCEGLMIKNLGNKSEYTPSKRCYNWIKLKKDYISGMSDTLDLVVLGCYYGKGRRAGSYGGFLMGCYNDEGDAFEAICKLGTGFNDSSLVEFYKKFQKLVVMCPKNVLYKDAVRPDVWIEPRYVWEIQAAGISLSPIYSAGISSLDKKGLSLRFPRFVRERGDRTAEESTSSSQIVAMYNNTFNEETKSEYDY